MHSSQVVVFKLRPSLEFWVCAAAVKPFCGKWVLKIAIKICYNFDSCSFMILSNNLHKNITDPIRKFHFYSGYLFSTRKIFVFSQRLFALQRIHLDSPNTLLVFFIPVPVKRDPIIWQIRKFVRTVSFMKSNYLFLKISHKINRTFNNTWKEKR